MMMSTGAFPPSGSREIGIVHGTSCMSRNFFSDTAATIHNATIGGELDTYSRLMSEGVELAMSRMKSAAEALGADGIYAVHIATPQVTSGAAEVIAYGTAYKLLV